MSRCGPETVVQYIWYRTFLSQTQVGIVHQPLGAYAKFWAEEARTGWVKFHLDESLPPAQTEVAKQTDACVSWSYNPCLSVNEAS